MSDSVVGTLAVIVGLCLVVFNKAFARHSVEGQNRTWGFHFGKSEEFTARIVTVIVGIGFASVGILALLGYVNWRK
jgi:hypothetical protein